MEGNDDMHVIFALCEKFAIPETFQIIDCKGVSQLIGSLPVRLKQSKIDTVGIVVDADTDLSKKWNSILDILSINGYAAIPKVIDEKGLIYREEGKKTIGIWLMPNNNKNGMLEDFIKFLIPNDDPLLPIAESTINSFDAAGHQRFKTIH